ncbi:MAG TPA: hypothetical protein ENK93_02625 [Campylobacteraceae bacterium]|nr:hypothetical protein [Campylobacteraceae bacterium]
MAFAVLLFSLTMLYDRYELLQPASETGLKHVDPLPRTMALVEAGKLAEASEYLGFFMQFGYVKNDPKAKELYEAVEFKRHTMAYRSKKVAEGVIEGRSDETIGKVSAGVSDLFLWGDIRDLSIEGYHYLKGEEVDKVLVALSTIGVAVTGLTVISGGSSAGVKGGVSALKLVRKSGKMPLWMQKYLIRSAKEIKKSHDLKPVKVLFEDIYDVTKASGFNTMTELLARSKSLKAFRASLGFAKTFGKESGAVLKVLGDDAPLYYRMLKNSTSRRTFLVATSYGKPGIKRLAKMGEKGFLKSLKPVVKTSRLTKLFSKHVVDFLERVPVGVYILMAAVSLLFLV